MDFEEGVEFIKEFKKLKKRYISLDDDLTIFKQALVKFPEGRGEKHWNRLYKKDESCSAWKARLACKTLKNSSLRVIYVHFPEIQKITFLEIYFKGDKENHDSTRLGNFLKNS